MSLIIALNLPAVSPSDVARVLFPYLKPYHPMVDTGSVFDGRNNLTGRLVKTSCNQSCV
jgi:hypothetical protein